MYFVCVNKDVDIVYDMTCSDMRHSLVDSG